MTSHCCFPAYLYRIGRAGSQRCFYCGDEDDTDYTLIVCRELTGERNALGDGLHSRLLQEECVRGRMGVLYLGGPLERDFGWPMRRKAESCALLPSVYGVNVRFKVKVRFQGESKARNFGFWSVLSLGQGCDFKVLVWFLVRQELQGKGKGFGQVSGNAGMSGFRTGLRSGKDIKGSVFDQAVISGLRSGLRLDFQVLGQGFGQAGQIVLRLGFIVEARFIVKIGIHGSGQAGNLGLGSGLGFKIRFNIFCLCLVLGKLRSCLRSGCDLRFNVRFEVNPGLQGSGQNENLGEGFYLKVKVRVEVMPGF
ncbi:hypothetical protein M0804_014084 [Polistes exclamans]|nr:hypothetical protein M0804_014084 [Polistes exclamans]